MGKIKYAVAASAAALALGGGLLAGGAPASADGVYYNFQSVASDLNLDGYPGSAVKSYTPDGTTTQNWFVESGKFDGYQLRNKAYPGKCAVAKGLNKGIALEDCNANILAQYWQYPNSGGNAASFRSAKYTDGCIQETGAMSQALLKPCDNADDQAFIQVTPS